MKFLAKILHSKQTVWTISELRILLGIKNPSTMKNFLQRMKKSDILFCPYRGIWCEKDFDRLELGAKIKSKSYISLQTVLQKEGIIFQDWSHTITLLSDNTLHLKVLDTSIQIHKIKKAILANPLHITNTGTYQIASVERATTDILYLDPNFYFDNISSLDTEKLEALSEIYNKTTQKSILFLIKKIKDGR